MLFENDNYDFDYDILSLAGFNFNRPETFYEYENKDVLVDPQEGFQRGNMWRKEYVPYKGMTYKKLNPTCDREALLFKIMELDFAINDLNLYLDLHPEDERIYEYFKKYTKECLELKDKYAKTYGPLTLDQTNTNTYEWMKNPWPWDKTGGSMYV